LIAVLVLGLAGCARPRARTEPQMPPLATPPPPPHQVAPAPPPLPSTPAEPAQAPPPGQTAPKPPTEKPEPSGKPRPTPTNPPPDRGAEEGPKTPPPTLQTAPAGESGAEARSIRDTLAKATKALGGVDYQRLGSDAKAQYDTAQRFIRQADAALKAQNYIVARNLADKAEVLANLLRGGA
jgi:hypothetical protein